jgi:cobalt transporter subunit CbtA
MMTLLRRLLLAALLAGSISGALLGIAQVGFATPLILKAEAHEQEVSANKETGHHEWEPEEGLERNAYTVLFATLTGIGFALLLNAGMLLRGRASIKEGLLWGCAGYAVFSLAPALGLPPELPGMPASDLLARQAWWVGTVLATAFGLSSIVFAHRAWLRALGIAALLVPHLIGAPTALVSEPSGLEELERTFVAGTLLIMLGFWLALGALSSLLHNKLLAEHHTAASFARPM